MDFPANSYSDSDSSSSSSKLKPTLLATAVALALATLAASSTPAFAATTPVLESVSATPDASLVDGASDSADSAASDADTMVVDEGLVATDADLEQLEDDATFATGEEEAYDDLLLGETVVVTANRMTQPLLDVSSSMAVVTPQQLNNLGRDNIPEMLRTAPGVRLMSDGTPGVKRVAIRGESASRTLIMVDGQRIDDQKNKSGAPLLVNPFFTERIEVVKGPSSVLYGSDAMGGIVNVITKQAAEEPFTFEGGLSFNGSNNSFSEYANIAGTLDRFKYVVGAFNTNTGDLYLSDRERLDNTSYNARGLNGDFSYDFTDKLTIGYAGDYFYSDAETSTTTDDATFGAFRGEIPEWSRQKHKLYFKAHDISEYLAAAEGSFYYQSNDKEFNSTPQDGLSVGVTNEQDTIGGNLQLEFSLGDMFYLVTGYDGRQEELDSSSDIGFDHMRAGPGYLLGNIGVRDNNYMQQSHALYAMLSTYLTDDLTLNTGVRYNYIKTNAGDSDILGGVTMNMMGQSIPYVVPESAYGDSTQVKTVGSVGLMYRAFDHGAFRLNWSQGFRVPNIQELYLLTSTGTLQFGNPDLKPEESDNYEFGFRWENPNGGLNADVAFFYSEADNYIETTNLGQFYTYRNIAEAKSYGLETSLAYLWHKWEPYVNVTLMERKYETESGSSTNTGTPRFSGNAGLRFYGDLFEVDAYADFATRTKNDNLDGSSYFGDTEFGGYVTYNLAVSTKVGPNDAITIYGSLENILDKNYQTNELIHEPGRFFTLGVKGNF